MSETTFSCAFSAFANDQLHQQIHEAMIKAHYGEKIAGHISRDGTAIHSSASMHDSQAAIPLAQISVTSLYDLADCAYCSMFDVRCSRERGAPLPGASPGRGVEPSEAVPGKGDDGVRIAVVREAVNDGRTTPPKPTIASTLP